MRNFRTALLYSIAILVAVAVSAGYIHNAPVRWFCIGLIVVLAGVAVCTLEPVYSRILPNRQQSSGTEESSGAERRALIDSWRVMVTEIHAKTRDWANKKTVTELLESHPDFPSIGSYLSERSKAAIFRQVSIIPAEDSTMPGALQSISDDIDRLERRWGLRRL